MEEKTYQYIAMLNNKNYTIDFKGTEHKIIDDIMQVLDNAINLINEYSYLSYDTDEDIMQELLEDTTLNYERYYELDEDDEDDESEDEE